MRRLHRHDWSSILQQSTMKIETIRIRCKVDIYDERRWVSELRLDTDKGDKIIGRNPSEVCQFVEKYLRDNHIIKKNQWIVVS